MELSLVLLALAGGAAGLAATALPGAHVNLLALLVLALWPDAGTSGTAFLVGALAGAPFGLALSGTLLGVSEDDSLPAHALAREGRSAEAIALQSWGAFAGLSLALVLAGALWPLAGRVSPFLPRIMPWLLLGIVTLLLVTEPARPRVHPTLVVAPWGELILTGELQKHKKGWRVGARLVVDPHGLVTERDVGSSVTLRVERGAREGPLSFLAGCALALLVLSLTGALGLVALRMGARSPVGLPASILLPLLAGLFAVPVLLAAVQAQSVRVRARLRAPRPPRGEVLRSAGPAALASSLLGLAPGVSASHVSLLAPRRRRPEEALLAVGGVNGGAVAFTLLAWHALGKARAGALVAAEAYAPPPPGITTFFEYASIALLAAGAACILARAASAPLARGLAALPSRAAPLTGLALLALATALTTGAWGLGVLVVAALAGETASRVGVRRGLCMGVILVPALLRAWGIA